MLRNHDLDAVVVVGLGMGNVIAPLPQSPGVVGGRQSDRRIMRTEAQFSKQFFLFVSCFFRILRWFDFLCFLTNSLRENARLHNM